MRLFLLAFLVAFVAGCSPSKLERTILNEQERQLARGAIDDLSRGDQGAFSRRLPSDLAQRLVAAFPSMRAAVPPPPFEVSLSNANRTSSGGVRTIDAVYEIKGGSKWALVELTMETKGGQLSLTSFYIRQTPGDPEKLYGFGLADAGIGGWAMLLVMAAAVGITIAALVRIWRSGMFRRRWLWTIGTLLGVSIFKLDWSSGAWGFQPLYVQLFSVGAFKQPIYSPWILSVSVPVVALIALFKKGYDEWDEPGLFPEEPPAAED